MIVGITGLIGSGKDTVADYLCTFHHFKRLSFAGTLKDAVSAVFGWDRELLEGSTKYSREWREQVDTWWAERLSMPNLTPRYILQIWGTEVGRKAFHNDIWIASLENKLRNTKDDIVISDCRFVNELDCIKRLGGTTLRIIRGPNPDWTDAALALNTGIGPMTKEEALLILKDNNVHASEYSSVGLEYDHYVHNNGTIDDLHKKIKSIIDL